MGAMLTVTQTATAATSMTPNATLAADATTAVADVGWATQSGGTSGGSTASPAHTYTVSTKAQLMAALKGTGPSGATDRLAAKIIKWTGAIDMTEGNPYANHADQAARGEVNLTPNTTIIGVGADASLPNGWFKISEVDNVIIRNVKVTNPCDLEPQWDPNDGAGNYNSEFDGLTIDGSTHVWIDHLWVTDAPFTDDKEPLGNKDKNGVPKPIQCHDGALDVKNASDYVTISNTLFENHRKNTMVGHSDSQTTDEGHLTVSFIANLYRNVTERAPRVRFGKVHVADNYFEGARGGPVYPYDYSIGNAFQSKIISDTNVFDITGVTGGSCDGVVHNPSPDSPGGAFIDTGSLVNGTPLAGCPASAVGWSLPVGYLYPKLAASDVKKYVQDNAGTGKRLSE